MTGPALPGLLDKVSEYPLFEALYGRRSRRFGLGFEMTEGPFKYKSHHAPVPLSDIEEALLRPKWAFPGLRCGTKAGRCHTRPARAAPSRALRGAAARRCCLRMTNGSTLSTLAHPRQVS